MPRPPALGYVRSSFENRLRSAADLYATVKPFADGTWNAINGWEPLYPTQARHVVGLAFMQIVIGWEDFAEAVFVRYLAGASSLNTYSPTLRLGVAKTVHHAYQLSSGNPAFDSAKHFLSWNKWREVEDRAKVFFDAGRPFTNLTTHEKQRLADCAIIRNRVAHSSNKCKSDFIAVARNHLGTLQNAKLPQGFSVGQLLLTSSNRLFGPSAPLKPFFEHYVDVFQSCMERLCPK